jgi:hypothetical protein
MVSKREKERMVNFITEKIEESRKYDISRMFKFGISVIQKKTVFESPKSIFVYAHHSKTPLNTFRSHESEISESFDCLSNVFYKNDVDFMVRLGASGNGRNNKSLKQYGHDEINRMISLRGLEKFVLNNQFYGDSLTFYQPQTQRLGESLRQYNMEEVFLDYSHLDSGTHAGNFARDGVSEDYKIANEITDPNPVLGFLGKDYSTRPIYLSLVPKR